MADIVNTGAAANDGSGDDLRTAFQLINERFQQLLGTLSQIAWAPGLAIQATPTRQWTVQAGQAYVAASNHIAGATFAADLAAGKWIAADVAQLTAALASNADSKGASLIGNQSGGTLQDVADAVGKVATSMAPTDIATAVAAARTAGGGLVALPSSGALSGSTPVEVIGEFTQGLVLDGRKSTITGTSTSADGLLIGNKVGQIAGSYFNKFAVRDVSVVGAGSSGTAAGVHQQAAADVVLDNVRMRAWPVGLLLDGGLTSDFMNLTISECGIGVQAKVFDDGITDSTPEGLNTFSPNANSFYGALIYHNTNQAVKYDNNPSGCVNWVGCNFEGNNTDGNTTDGVKVIEMTQAGHHNFIGTHHESNLGQYSMYYQGADSSKTLFLAGVENIDATGTNVHMAAGVLTSIASRITNASSTEDIHFGAGTSGTLIDTEGSIHGTLGNVVAVRKGRIGFGVQPVASSPLIDATSAAIAAALNIAASWQNDVVQLRMLNSAGTRVAYIQTSAAGDHVLHNQNASGGWALGAGNVTRAYVGRGGAASVEPGADNTTTLGSGTLRWSQLYAATATINTSDARTKQQVRDLNDAEKAVGRRLKGMICAFKFNDSVREKGDGARVHFGVIAQQVMTAFEAEGLDPFAYGVVCHDSWPEQVISTPDPDEPEQMITTTIPASDRYGVRYEELFALVLGAL